MLSWETGLEWQCQQRLARTCSSVVIVKVREAGAIAPGRELWNTLPVTNITAVRMLGTTVNPVHRQQIHDMPVLHGVRKQLAGSG